jgi:hypothetical protein
MRAFMGVSLGSRRFTREFLAWLPEYLRVVPISTISIVVADHLEVYNYLAFRGERLDRARVEAARRGTELCTMIGRAAWRFARRDITMRVTLSSGDREILRAASDIQGELEGLRCRSVDLKRRLVQYVVGAAPGRIQRIPLKQRCMVALAASDYLLAEAAWSRVFLSRHSVDYEVHPGKEQPFKAALLRGLLTGATHLALERPPRFLDCTAAFTSRLRPVTVGQSDSVRAIGS